LDKIPVRIGKLEGWRERLVNDFKELLLLMHADIQIRTRMIGLHSYRKREQKSAGKNQQYPLHRSSPLLLRAPEPWQAAESAPPVNRCAQRPSAHITAHGKMPSMMGASPAAVSQSQFKANPAKAATPPAASRTLRNQAGIF
jgi:hypothetical protein